MKIKYLYKKITSVLLSLSCFLFFNCTNKNNEISHELKYPLLKQNVFTETVFQQKITDDFRFLETDTGSLVKQWIDKENKLYDSVFKEIPFRDAITRKIEKYIYSSNIRGGFPRVVEKKLFFLRIDIQKNIQKIVYKDSLQAKEIEIFSTEQLTKKDKTYSIDFFEPSTDGKYLALGISSNGDEMTEMKVIDVDKNNLLPDLIERATYGFPVWLPNKNAFFYTQLKDVKTDEDINTMYENSVVKLHVINTNSINDKIVFSKQKNQNLSLVNIDLSNICAYPSSDKLLASVQRGSTLYTSLYYTSITNSLKNNGLDNINNWLNVCNADDKVTVFTLKGNDVYALSFKDNPNGALVKFEITNGAIQKHILLEGKEAVLEDIIQTENALYIKKLKNGISSVLKFDFQTLKFTPIQLPFNGYINLKPFFGVPTSYLASKDLFFSIESWNKEIGIYKYDFNTNQTIKTDLRKQGEFGDMNNIIVEEIEIKGHDGALIPLSIVYQKGLTFNGENPTIMEAYGAYGISINSYFDLSRMAWLNMGGVFAIAHVRGGGEKGDAWYKGGFKKTKANSWKDFISCAEYLIQKKYTSPEKLAAKGESAGGITIGRAITDKPNLFKVAILNVGALNTFRIENTNNTFSVSEFGTVKDSLEFKYLYEMDVYQHIKEGVLYPTLLVTAGLNDARVDWWQPAKAVAQFQKYATQNNNIILFNVNTSGHFGEPNIAKEDADIYSFLLWQLHHKPLNVN